MSFVVCVSDDAVLKANMLASPGIAGRGSPHDIILIHEAPSAAAGLAMGLTRAKHEWVVCVHQDVYLPDGWDRCLAEQIREAGRRFGPIGVVGVYGVSEVIAPADLTRPLGAKRIGWVVDRGRELREGPELPARVAILDELLLVVRRNSELRFDPALGFHLYGADICLQARERGLAVVALGALCHHNSRSVGLPEAFFASAEVFARKWSHRLPIATPCVIIGRCGRVHLLENAMAGPRSIAYALPKVGATKGGLSTEGTEKHGNGRSGERGSSECLASPMTSDCEPVISPNHPSSFSVLFRSFRGQNPRVDLRTGASTRTRTPTWRHGLGGRTVQRGLPRGSRD